MNRIVVVVLVALLSPAASARWKVPANVTTTPDGRIIEAVDFSYQSTSPVSFDKLKMCVAENVTNDSLTLGDSAGSFVGPATGRYYSNGKTQTVQGGQVFKFIDDSSMALVASGSTPGHSDPLGIMRTILRFDIKAATSPEAVTLKFMHIASAQQDTGSMANPGFTPVGTWWGSGGDKEYAALENLAGKIKGCLQ